MIRICKLCHQSNDAVEFYAGVNSRCKECHKRRVRENRVEQSEQYRLYEKMRYQRDIHRRENNRAYALTEKGRQASAKARAKFLELNPEKRAAHIILGNAVRDGKISKPSQCQRCKAIPPRRMLHGHHHDYTQPLSVEWLCVNCHALEHHGVSPDPPAFARSRGRNVRIETQC